MLTGLSCSVLTSQAVCVKLRKLPPNENGRENSFMEELMPPGYHGDTRPRWDGRMDDSVKVEGS